jgi:hypothetical protein
MTPLRLVAALVGLAALVAAFPAAAFPLDCIVRGAADRTLDVVHDGEVARTLHGGDHVYGAILMGDFQVTARDGDEWLLGYAQLDPADLDCDQWLAGSDYPLVVTSGEELAELGIASVLYAPVQEGVDPDGTKTLAREPNVCFDVGEGTFRISLSDAHKARLAAKGVNLDLACLVMESGQVRFDPETGKRLPTYVMVTKAFDGTFIRSQELLLDVPSCFARGKAEISTEENYALLQPLGCDLKFHPWTGKPLSGEDRAYFTPHALLYLDGHAGSSALDGESLAADSTRRITAAKIQALKLK